MPIFAVSNRAVVFESTPRLPVFVKAQLTKFPISNYLNTFFPGSLFEFFTNDLIDRNLGTAYGT